MRTAPVKAIVLPAVYRANLEFQSHVPFQHSRTRVIDLRTRGRRGFCIVHSLTLGAHAQRGLRYLGLSVCLLSQISPLERLFVLKILSRTQRATEVKKFVGFSLKPLRSKVMASFAYP